MIYPGPLGKILIHSDESVQLYDVSARKVLHEIAATDVKSVYWNLGFTHAAIITKTQIIITNKNLEIVHSQKENAKIKTGSFDENNAFVYSTSTHVKYIFLEGKTSGTFKSIDEPLYVSFFMKN
jgi:coatomer subunit alpha